MRVRRASALTLCPLRVSRAPSRYRGQSPPARHRHEWFRIRKRDETQPTASSSNSLRLTIARPCVACAVTSIDVETRGSEIQSRVVCTCERGFEVDTTNNSNRTLHRRSRSRLRSRRRSLLRLRDRDCLRFRSSSRGARSDERRRGERERLRLRLERDEVAGSRREVEEEAEGAGATVDAAATEASTA